MTLMGTSCCATPWITVTTVVPSPTAVTNPSPLTWATFVFPTK